jgi:hypothetical protein
MFINVDRRGMSYYYGRRTSNGKVEGCVSVAACCGCGASQSSRYVPRSHMFSLAKCVQTSAKISELFGTVL